MYILLERNTNIYHLYSFTLHQLNLICHLFPIQTLLDQLSFPENQRLNVTDEVLNILNAVPVVTQSNESVCCNYQNQILDQFCASQSAVGSSFQ